MSLLSKSLFLLAGIQLLHSGYSSYEFHQVIKQASMTSTQATHPTLPLDIKIEAIFGLLVFILAEFISHSPLEHLTIRGPESIIRTNDYLKPIALNKRSDIDIMINKDQFGEINYHPSFVDIHAKRSQMKTYLESKSKDQ